MNKSEFIEILNQPNHFDSEKIESIQSLVQDFPYFQSSQLLLSKAFHLTENFNFEQQLRKSAAYAADRKILHELLFSETAVFEKTNVPETESDLTESNLVPEKVTDALSEKTEEQAITSAAIENKVPEMIDKPALEERLNEEILEQQVLVSAINSSLLLEVSDEINLEDHQVTLHKSEISQIKPDPKKSGDLFDETASHSFSGWLSHLKDESTTKPIWESEEAVIKVKSIVSEKNQLPVKQEFYSAANMAKLSVQDNDDLVTETLATIYADQGNYEKAINSFKKLQLKYPEKKIYFAGRIKEIENQLNTL